MLASKGYTGDSKHQLSRWALINAWRLSGLTALVTLVGMLFPVILSFLLRPTRSYVLPLLSDVTRHQPEGALLRLSICLIAALFFVTTIASILHCHTLHIVASAANQNIFAQHSHAHSSMDIGLGDDLDVSEIAPTSAVPSTPRRRSSRFSTTNVLLILSFTAIVSFSALHEPALLFVALKRLRRVNYVKVFVNFGFYMLILFYIFAMSFLTWYFLRLQNLPDCPPFILAPASSPVASPDMDLYVEGPHLSNGNHGNAKKTTVLQSLSQRLRAFFIWLIVLLRPICLTGQAVCVIKIAGLCLALDTFSIANIRIVKITLLAALSFMQYTAVFFFSFFMTILAIDLRSKAPPPELIPDT